MLCTRPRRSSNSEPAPRGAASRTLGRALALAFLVAAALLLAPAANIQAATLQHLTVEEMAQAADSILLARTISTESRQMNSGSSVGSFGDIRTIIDLEVIRILKGAAGPQRVITVPGGTVGSLRETVDYAPEFSPGETSILFLDPWGRVIGGPQGKLTVLDGAVPMLDASLPEVLSRISSVTKGTFSVDQASVRLSPAGSNLDSASLTDPQPPYPPGDATLHAQGVLLDDGFESGGTAWSTIDNPTWAVTSYRSSAGSWSAYCAGSLASAGPYAPNMNAWLKAGPFDLSAVGSASLEFDLYLETETDHDFFWVTASSNGLNFHGYKFSGSSGGRWERHVFDLAEYVGQPAVWVAFAFTSDGATNLEGAYVDEVQLITGPGLPPVITGISPGSTSAGTNSQVTIYGTRFGGSQGVGKVTFYSSEDYAYPAPIISWSDSAITCVVPAGSTPDGHSLSAGSGPVRVTNFVGLVSTGHDFQVTFSYQGHRWTGSSAPYRVNANTIHTPLASAFVDAAAATWNAASSFTFVDAGTCSTIKTSRDGYNDVFWSAYLLPEGVLGTTTIYRVGSTVVECDICFDDTPAYPWGDGTDGTYDLQSAALHELGHWLSLNDLYGPGDAAKVMYGKLGTGTVRRSLHEGDAAGIRWIYNSSGPTTTTSTTTTTTTTSTTTTTQPPTTTTTIPHVQQFSDVPDWHPYSLQINDVADWTIVDGYSDGTFRPDNLVIRQQFAKMIVGTLARTGVDVSVNESSVCPFTDVTHNPIDLYPYHWVAACAALGITQGKTATTFAPYDNLTRAQLITMVARAANLPEPPPGYSPPFGNFSAIHYPWARKAYYAGLLDGLLGIDTAGYAFWANASRGEVCVLLYNLLHW